MSDTSVILWTIVIVVGITVWVLLRRNRSAKLQSRFGDEYDRLISDHGDRGRAEAELERREHRVERLQLRSMTREELDRFARAWRIEQERFVDDPHGAVLRADGLLCEVMQARGYPSGAFEERAADISVGHSQVVQLYRAAHEILVRDEFGQVDTEALRIAMQHFRQLFDELLEPRELAEPKR